jgi:hypothetical protein
MDEVEESLQDSMAAIQEVAHSVKPPDAWRRFGDVTVESFWQSWPEIRAWGEWLWTLIDNERGEKATPVAPDAETDETGGGG